MPAVAHDRQAVILESQVDEDAIPVPGVVHPGVLENGHRPGQGLARALPVEMDRISAEVPRSAGRWPPSPRPGRRRSSTGAPRSDGSPSPAPARAAAAKAPPPPLNPPPDRSSRRPSPRRKAGAGPSAEPAGVAGPRPQPRRSPVQPWLRARADSLTDATTMATTTMPTKVRRKAVSGSGPRGDGRAGARWGRRWRPGSRRARPRCRRPCGRRGIAGQRRRQNRGGHRVGERVFQSVADLDPHLPVADEDQEDDAVVQRLLADAPGLGEADRIILEALASGREKMATTIWFPVLASARASICSSRSRSARDSAPA